MERGEKRTSKEWPAALLTSLWRCSSVLVFSHLSTSGPDCWTVNIPPTNNEVWTDTDRVVSSVQFLSCWPPLAGDGVQVPVS